MAGQVVVELTAQDKISGVLNRIRNSSKNLQDKLGGAVNNVKGRFKGLQGAAVQLNSVLGSLAVGAVVKGFADAGVQADRTAKRLQFLGDQFGETAQLQAFANEAASKFTVGQTEAASAVADLFGRLRPMGVSLEEIQTVFNGVNVAANQMSLSTADTEGVMLQLSQALGSGKLQGDEFRSIMERLPKIGQAVAKSMDVTVGQLKDLSSQGKLTTDVIIKALQGIEKEGFPEPDGVKQFNKAIKDLSKTIGQRLTPILDPILKGVAGLVNLFLDLPEPVKSAVIAFTGIATALATIAPLLPIIATGIGAIVTVLTGPIGLIAGIGAVVAAFVTMKGKAKETKKPMEEVTDEAKKTKDALKAAAQAKQELLSKTKEHIGALRSETLEITKAEQAFENSLQVTDARLNAEIAINKMQNQGLQIAYDQAGSADKRLEIAKQIFKNEVAGAKLAYEQTLNSIEAEQVRLQFRKEGAEIEARMIQAKGELAAAEADSAEKAALILEKTAAAVDVQREQVGMIDGQIEAQKQIAGFQRQAAEAQLKAAIMTSEQNLNQKLVSDEIGMSQIQADKLTAHLGDSARNSIGLEGATKKVSTNAINAAGNFIRVATEADKAATAIYRAADAQNKLNTARSSSSSSTSTTVSQAEGGYNLGSFKAFAKGGVVKGPTLGLIGEGGEPEYIIPESKAAGFAANYLTGSRGAGAIPGFEEGGYAGPINITTGPVMQQEGTNYVTMAQFQEGVREVANAVTRGGRSYGARRFTGIN